MTAPQVGMGQFKTSFRVSFKHASATRSVTENVIVWIGEPGTPDCGFGEACPRSYVTGETVATAGSFIKKYGAAFAAQVQSIAGLRAWITDNESKIDANPSAFAALEQALLDRIGRQENIPLETVVTGRAIQRPATYSAVFGDASFPKFTAQAFAYRLYGMRSLKVKLSSDPIRDRQKFRTLRRIFGQHIPIRADANNLWASSASVVSHLRKAQAGLWAIEEPLLVGDLAGCRQVAAALNLRIILDESLNKLKDLDPLMADADSWIANIRVSKVGGILRAIELANRAADAGIGVVLGAHVGETSLLTRASLVVANCLKSPPLAMEGAFGTRLLASDIVTSSIMFGHQGVLNTLRHAVFKKPGNGLGIRHSGIVIGNKEQWKHIRKHL